MGSSRVDSRGSISPKKEEALIAYCGHNPLRNNPPVLHPCLSCLHLHTGCGTLLGGLRVLFLLFETRDPSCSARLRARNAT